MILDFDRLIYIPKISLGYLSHSPFEIMDMHIPKALLAQLLQIPKHNLPELPLLRLNTNSNTV